MFYLMFLSARGLSVSFVFKFVLYSEKGRGFHLIILARGGIAFSFQVCYCGKV